MAAQPMARASPLLLLSVTCVLAAPPGCMAVALGPTMAVNKLTTRYKRVEFRVIDAISGRPISGAMVGVDYRGMNGTISDDVGGVTDDRGRVDLRVAIGANAYTGVVAPGYLPLHDEHVLGLDPLDKVVLPLRPIGSARVAATIAP
jgi:hypothetical protein